MNKVSIILSFPLKARFNINPYIFVYKDIWKFIKKLNCYNLKDCCLKCEDKKHCRYYQLSGFNFTKMPLFYIKTHKFYQQKYVKNEELVFEFYVLDYLLIEYIKLYFEEKLNQQLIHNFFCLKENIVNDYVIEENYVENIQIITPIKNDFINEYNRCIKNLDDLLGDKHLQLKETKEKLVEIVVHGKKERMNGLVFDMSGSIYELVLNQKILNLFIELGVGENNFLGGGQFEIKN